MLKSAISGTVKWVGGGNAPTGLRSTGAAFVIATNDDMLEQWKLLLLFACSCIEIPKATEVRQSHSVMMMSGTQASSRLAGIFLSGSGAGGGGGSGVQSSNPMHQQTRPQQQHYSEPASSSASTNKIITSRQLFQLILPLLSCERSSIRYSAVIAIGSVHWMSYQTLLEDIQPYLKNITDEMRHRLQSLKEMVSFSSSDKRKATLPNAQNKKFDRLRTEMAHLLSLITDFISYDVYRENESFMSSIYAYMRDTARFLSDQELQLEWDHQMLRYHFCVFLENYFDHLVKSIDSIPSEYIERYVPFDTRLSLFRICEMWCGHGLLADSTRSREAKMMQYVLDQVKDVRERGVLTASMEEQRKALELAALRAMSSLCSGNVVNPKNPALSFDLKALIFWINSIFGSPDEKLHDIARLALENLLKYNRKNAQLISDIINQCYTGLSDSHVTKGYFMALVDIFVPPSEPKSTPLSRSVHDLGSDNNKLNSNNSAATPISTSEDPYPLHCAPHRLLCLALYKAGDQSLTVRKAAVKLLHCLEKVVNHALKGVVAQLDAQDYEPTAYEAAAITSSLPIIYKYAQATVSARLAKDHRMMTNEVCDLEICGMNGIITNPPPPRNFIFFFILI